MNKIFLILVIIGVSGIAAFILFYKQNKITQQNLTNTQSDNPSATMQPTQTQTVSEGSLPKHYVFPSSSWVTNATRATIITTKGNIVITLYLQDAPKTVTNFATLAKSGYYNGLTFHRVEPGFVIQGGDPNGNGTGGYSIYGQIFADELNPNTPSALAGYKEGVVAMANSGPNTNGSQFFIMLADDSTLPYKYTIFGKVTSGMDVVHKIAVGDKMLQVKIQ